MEGERWCLGWDGLERFLTGVCGGLLMKVVLYGVWMTVFGWKHTHLCKGILEGHKMLQNRYEIVSQSSRLLVVSSGRKFTG